jgi:unsaturated rhamnogalacturonyl hydrolase
VSALRLAGILTAILFAVLRITSAQQTPTAPQAAGVSLARGETADLAKMGAGQKVLLDAWYNSQKRKNATGQNEYFHYKWDDSTNSGFSLFGQMFRSYGLITDTLYTAPTLAKLKDAQYYIIVSPDNPAKNPNPHYMTAADAKEIAEWVKRGGVLLMMENDPANADITHMDLLADTFGLHFNDVQAHHVIGDQHEMGRMEIPAGGPLFHHPHVLFMKDTCSLSLTKNAVSLLQYKGDILMGYAKYGKGAVYAVTDPWLYNEYTDGHNLPAEYDNYAAGMELIPWLLQQHAKTH